MRVHEQMTVAAPLASVWEAIADPTRLAPCIPGAEIERDLGDGRYAGRVRVRVGPMALSLKGELTVTEIDAAAKRLSLRGSGRDDLGLGRADATISVAARAEAADVTVLDIDAEVKLGGPVAQVGRQAIVNDIARSILQRMGGCIAERATAPSA